MTTDTFRALCAELVNELADFQWAAIEAGVGWAHPDTEALIERARAAVADEPAAPLPLADTHYEWELVDAEGEWQAGGSSNSQTDVEYEGMRQGYARDGVHKLIIRQHTTQTINEITYG